MEPLGYLAVFPTNRLVLTWTANLDGDPEPRQCHTAPRKVGAQWDDATATRMARRLFDADVAVERLGLGSTKLWRVMSTEVRA